MRIVVIESPNGEYQATDGKKYLLVEVEDGVALATMKTVVNAESAMQYAIANGLTLTNTNQP